MLVVEENKPRRRTSTSVSSANGSVDLACDNDSNNLNHDKPTGRKDFTQQQWSAISTVLVLASLLLFALYVSAGRWRGARPHIGEFLAGTSEDVEGMPSLGIILHPNEHRSRNAGIATLHWTITSDIRAPDGVKKRVYLINGNICISYLLGPIHFCQHNCIYVIWSSLAASLTLSVCDACSTLYSCCFRINFPS